jgi:hypothetical protein
MAVSSTPIQTPERADHAAIAEVVESLRDVVGDQITAIIAGIEDPSMVERWAAGQQRPHRAVERRLRDGLRVVELLRRQETPDTIRAWLVGKNPELDDRAAAVVIAEDPDLVLDAARFFMANG